MSDESAKILKFRGITLVNLPAEQVLQAAIDLELESVTIMGYTKDGEEYFSSTESEAGFSILLARRLEHMLMTLLDAKTGREH